MKTCPGCGAPIVKSECDYCGRRFGIRAEPQHECVQYYQDKLLANVRDNVLLMQYRAMRNVQSLPARHATLAEIMTRWQEIGVQNG